METTSAPAVATKGLWHVVRVLYYTLRKGVSKRKLTVDVHLLLERGKLAGKKAMCTLMFLHHSHHHHHHNSSSDLLVSNKNKKPQLDRCDAKAIQKAFEILNSKATDEDFDVVGDDEFMVNTPLWSFGRSPAMVRQLRITDSPFPLREEGEEEEEEEEEGGGGGVDVEAEEFIVWFYEQLRQQQRMEEIEERALHG